jgi:hypothetical protein
LVGFHLVLRVLVDDGAQEHVQQRARQRRAQEILVEANNGLAL